MIVVEEDVHSKLGASSSHRWMACPGSVRLSREAGKGAASQFAAEGTAAHEIGFLALDQGQPVEAFLGKTVKVGEYEFEVDEEMAEAVSVYVDYVFNLYNGKGDPSFEQKFHLSLYDERLFGKNDACVYVYATKTLHVIDYKHGKGVKVDAFNNSQLKYYAIGALMNLQHPCEKVVCTIVQPRVGVEAISSWATTPIELTAFAQELIDAANLTDDPNAPLVVGDKQCLFCPAAAICPAREKEAYETADALFGDDGGMELATPPELVGENYLPVVLERAKRIEDWVAAVRARAHQLAVEGRPPQGYKLVDKQARRKWMADEETVLAKLQSHGLKGDDLYTKKVLSPAQAEKKIGKKKFETYFGKEIVDAVSSGTVLMPVDDHRPAVISNRNPDALFG